MTRLAVGLCALAAGLAAAAPAQAELTWINRAYSACSRQSVSPAPYVTVGSCFPWARGTGTTLEAEIDINASRHGALPVPFGVTGRAWAGALAVTGVPAGRSRYEVSVEVLEDAGAATAAVGEAYVQRWLWFRVREGDRQRRFELGTQSEMVRVPIAGTGLHVLSLDFALPTAGEVELIVTADAEAGVVNRSSVCAPGGAGPCVGGDGPVHGTAQAAVKAVIRDVLVRGG